MTKQTCCRAHLCLLHSGLLMLHAHTRCCRPAIQPRTHTSANKRASWKFSRTPCVRCLSLAGGQGCACLPNLSAVDTAGSSSCWLAALSSNSASQACSERLVQAPPPADAAVRTRPTCQGPPALSCPRACVWSHARRGWRPGAAPPLAAGHAHAPSTAWDKKQKGNAKEQQQDNSNLFKSKTPRGHRRVGPPFPANPWYKVSNFHHKILTLGEKREEEKEQ